MPSFSALIVLPFLSLFASPSYTTLVNITVDDANPDPITGTSISYSPPMEWSFGPDCTPCVAKPDPIKVFDATWHDVTFLPAVDSNHTQTATLVFNGSAVYAYCIIAPTSSTLDGNTDLSFFLDGHAVGSFDLDPTGLTMFQYDVLVYANSSISPGSHSFVVQNGRAGGQTSLLLLDYMIFSTDTGRVQGPLSDNPSTSPSVSLTKTIPPPSPSSGPSSSTSLPGPVTSSASFAESSGSSALSSHTRTVVIAVMCSVGGLLALLALAYFLHRRRRLRDSVDTRRYAYDLPPDRDISDDPMSSGWVDGTWDHHSPPTQHPFLPHAISPQEPLRMCGAVVSAMSSDAAGKSAASEQPRSEWLSAATYEVARAPHSHASSIDARPPPPMIHHPYATSGHVKGSLDDEEPSPRWISANAQEELGEFSAASLPQPTVVRREVHQASVLASQAEAAQARQQNSVRTVSEELPPSPPPPYERLGSRRA